MREAYCQTFKELSRTGIYIRFLTLRGGHHPPHWHETLELIFPLNGDTDIIMEGTRHKLKKRHLFVVETGKVHSIHALDKYSMFLSIHISKKEMEKYLPDIAMYETKCYPQEFTEEKQHDYDMLCKFLEVLTRLYMEEPPTFLMEAEGLILQIYGLLLRRFSVYSAPEISEINQLTMERVRTIINYVEEHFREPITLTDAAEQLGIGKEYFCRFFKKNMGTSFLQYLGEVRIAHIYQDVLNTDKPIAQIIEENGFLNQKLCNKMFKEIYGCTPSAVRKNAPTAQPALPAQ